MLVRSALVSLAVVTALSGCGSSDSPTVKAASSPTATPTATASACTPSGTGTTDLTKKPVITKPTTPAPTQTQVIDIVCGTGPVAVDASKVAVKYVGVLFSNGQEFDSSWKAGSRSTLPFTVGDPQGVIPGFSKGTIGMRVGGRREIIIPPSEGYGDQANGPIPAGSTLIFVIDLVSVG